MEKDIPGLKRGKTPGIDLREDLDLISYDIPYPQLLDMDTTDVGTVGLKCLNVANAIRGKCGRVQGILSGQLKTKFGKVKEVINALMVRLGLG